MINRPTNFTYYTSDPYLNRRASAPPIPIRTAAPTISYRAFADRNVCRRTLLFAASNDGQLHAFDAGIFRDPPSGAAECLLPAKDLDGDGVVEVDEFTDGVVDYDVDDDIESETDHVLDGAYDNGSGREVFSFIPRAMLETQLTLVEEQDRNKGPWGIDGSPRIDDVFIDPQAAENGIDDLRRSRMAVGARRRLPRGRPGLLRARHHPARHACDNLQRPAADRRLHPLLLRRRRRLRQHAPIRPCSGSSRTSTAWSSPPAIFADLELDEDLNDERDLGDSWSRPATGRIRVCTGACGRTTRPRTASSPSSAAALGDDPTFRRGNCLYMVDIETGKMIYKKRGDRLDSGRHHRRRLERRHLHRPALLRHHGRLRLQGAARASAATPMRLIDQTSRPAAPASTTTSPPSA